MTDKQIMQQALAALQNSIDCVKTEHAIAVENYGTYASRKPRIDGLKDDVNKHEAAIIALQLALAQPVHPAPTWQPIDTAPQDDTAVDLWDAWGERHCNMQRVVHTVINIYYTVLPGQSGSGCERSVHSGGHITHWMPVPGAPV